MALWKARSLSIEQNVQLVEDDPENESVTSEESVTLIGSGDVSMSEVQCCSLQVPENALDWVKQDKRRMLHVGDLDKSIKFYTECLGMKVLRKRDMTEERYTNAFLGYGPEDAHFAIELTYIFIRLANNSTLKQKLDFHQAYCVEAINFFVASSLGIGIRFLEGFHWASKFIIGTISFYGL
ncbi:hypothetical protein RYX36_014127 [Vicia faba]